MEHGLDAEKTPGVLLSRLGVPYVRYRSRTLHWAIRRGRLPSTSAWRAAVALTLKAGDCCLDLGANIGRVTQEAAWRVGPSGTVHSFEPSPVAAARLRRRVGRLGLRQVVVNECAVGEREGTATLYEYPRVDGGASSLRPQAHTGTAPSATREVRVITVDDYVERHGLETVVFVKIDVEGAELEVLRGAERLLTRARPRPALLIEVSPLTQAGFGRRVQDVLDHAHELGYSTWSWQPEGLVPIHREEELPPGSRRDDLLALHAEGDAALRRCIDSLATLRP